MIDIEKPGFTSDDTAERVAELKRYLDRLADDLNYTFDVLTEKIEKCAPAAREEEK